MTKPMTHLHAFLDEYAVAGRMWSDGVYFYNRKNNMIQRKLPQIGSNWEQVDAAQLDASASVAWADEPKTLTPQEALLALADGKCLRTKDGEFFLMREGGRIATFAMTYNGSGFVDASIGDLSGCVIVPDPSQPAEQHEHIYQARSLSFNEPKVAKWRIVEAL